MLSCNVVYEDASFARKCILAIRVSWKFDFRKWSFCVLLSSLNVADGFNKPIRRLVSMCCLVRLFGSCQPHAGSIFTFFGLYAGLNWCKLFVIIISCISITKRRRTTKTGVNVPLVTPKKFACFRHQSGQAVGTGRKK